MIVVDASVLANAFTDDGAVGMHARAELAQDPHWTAPEHLIVETFSAIRGRWLGHKVTEERAVDALTAVEAAAIDLFPVHPWLTRMWELRSNLSGYDAAYVAAAEAFNCALVTADARLLRVPGLRCDVRLALPGR